MRAAENLGRFTAANAVTGDSGLAKAFRFGCSLSWGLASLGCGVVIGAAYAAKGDWSKATRTAAESVAGALVGGAVARGVVRGAGAVWKATRGVTAQRAVSAVARKATARPTRAAVAVPRGKAQRYLPVVRRHVFRYGWRERAAANFFGSSVTASFFSGLSYVGSRRR